MVEYKKEEIMKCVKD